MDLATRLRQAIDATGEKQSWVAARANVPEETISRIVTGQSQNPQVGTLLKIAPVVGVTVGWLLGERGAAVSASEAQTIAAAIDILRRLSGTVAEPGPNAAPIGRGEHTIPTEFASRGARWVFRASGESMLRAGIREGDRLYVREVRDVRQAIGHIAVCRIGGGVYAKRLDIIGDRITLVSETDTVEPLIVRDESEFALLGIVVGRSGDV
jgi:SOS-response transcriptional repressor LexA